MRVSRVLALGLLAPELGRGKQPYADALTDERDGGAAAPAPTDNAFDRVNVELGHILAQLTPGGTGAWQPLEDVFAPCAQDRVKTAAIQKAKKEAAEAARAAEETSEDVASAV